MHSGFEKFPDFYNRHYHSFPGRSLRRNFPLQLDSAERPKGKKAERPDRPQRAARRTEVF